MAKEKRPEHQETEQNEIQQRPADRYQRVERLARNPTLQSSISVHAPVHPSAIVAVRPNSPRYPIDLERVTNFDVTRLPTLPRGSAAISEQTDPRVQRVETSSNTAGHRMPGSGACSDPISPDLPPLPRRPDASSSPIGPEGSRSSRQGMNDRLTAHIFHNIEDVVPIDEIGTLPPDVQGRLRSKTRRSTEPLTISEMDTRPPSSVERKQPMISDLVETMPLTAMHLPTGSGQTDQLQGGSTWGGLDKIRWWLLYPGRLEVLLWSIGIIILISATGFFVLAITISLGLFGSGGHIG